jgi:hypothetical protein
VLAPAGGNASLLQITLTPEWTSDACADTLISVNVQAVSGKHLDVSSMLSGQLKRQWLAHTMDKDSMAGSTAAQANTPTQQDIARRVNMELHEWPCVVLPSLTCVDPHNHICACDSQSWLDATGVDHLQAILRSSLSAPHYIYADAATRAGLAQLTRST